MAAFFLFVLRFFYAAEARLGQMPTVVCWSLFAVSLVTTPLMLLVFQLKGEWNISPQRVLQVSAAALVDRPAVAKPLYALLGSLDLVFFWSIFLLSSGLGAVAKRRSGSTAWAVIIPWAIIVLLKVGWSALFSCGLAVRARAQPQPHRLLHGGP